MTLRTNYFRWNNVTMEKGTALGVYILAASFALCTMRSGGANPSSLHLEPSRVDFGTVSAGVVPNQNVRIKNTEKVPIRLLSVRSSCPCTSATMEATTLQPGDEVEITIKLDLQDYPSDKVSSTIYVSAEGYEFNFPVVATVRREYAVYPERLELGTVKRMGKSKQKFYVYQVGMEDLLLEEVKTPANVTATVLEVVQKTTDLPSEVRDAKRVYEVEVVFQAPDDRGLYTGDISVVTGAKRLPAWTLPVNAELEGIDFKFEPGVGVLGQSSRGGIAGEAILIVDDASVLEATSSDKSIAVSVTELERRGKYSLHLESTRDAEPRSYSGKIRVRLQQGDLTQDVELFFYGTVR